MTGSSVYNTTDGPLPYDRAGRVLGARERLNDVDVSAQPVKGHIEAGRFIDLNDQADDATVLDTVALDDAPADVVEDDPAPAPIKPTKPPRAPRTTTQEN